MIARILVLCIVLTGIVVGQPASDHLRMTLNRGALEFPRALNLPFSAVASQAPVLTITDERPAAAGYRLVLRWELSSANAAGASLETVPGVTLAHVSPGGVAGLPPVVETQSGFLTPGGELTILRADRSFSEQQGEGIWMVQINPNALRLRLPRGMPDGTYPGTIRLLLYPSP